VLWIWSVYNIGKEKTSFQNNFHRFQSLLPNASKSVQKANYSHQKLTERLAVSDLTWCHHLGGMYSTSPGPSKQPSPLAPENKGNWLRSGFSGSTCDVLDMRHSLLNGYNPAWSGGNRSTLLWPLTWVSKLCLGSWWRGETVPSGPSQMFMSGVELQ
jgi:hypothetical protein